MSEIVERIFWSQSFCLISTGGATIEIVRKYIESQGEKHLKQIKHTNSEYILMMNRKLRLQKLLVV